MIVDELILKLQADLDSVKKGLAQVQVDAAKAGKEAGEKMGKAAGTSFGDVFNAIAGAAVLKSVQGFFGKAEAAFNKIESAFLRVDSIAKGFGRSVELARKNVNELADKGFLNLSQSATSYANAIALGFDEKKARNFIDALSDIAAYQNTIGDGAAAVESGLAGLLSNSAEKVENIGVPIKVLNMEYQKNIATMGKAAAMQKFYNGVLKESEKFQGDAARSTQTLAGAQAGYNAAVERSMAAIGKGLEPTLKSLYKTLESGFKWFTSWFESLDSSTKTIALMVPVVVALTMALGAMLPVLKMLSLANPFGWVAAAVTALGALLVVIRQLNADRNPELVAKKYQETAKAYKEIGDRAKELEAINKRTAAQEKELAGIKENLRAKAKALGVDYEQLAKSAKNAADMTQMLTNIERERAAEKLRQNLRDIQTRRGAVTRGYGNFSESQSAVIDLAVQTRGGQSRAEIMRMLDEQERQNIQGLVDIYQSTSATGQKSAESAAAAAASKAIEQRFIESQNKLKEIEANRLVTIQRLGKKLNDKAAEEERQRRIGNAEKDAEFQRQSLRGSFQQVFAEYIEDRRAADLLALSEQTRNAKRASEEQLSYELALAGKNEKLIQEAKEKNRKRLAKIDEANAEKQAAISIEAVNRNLQAANATTTGIAQIARAKDVGGALSGFGTTAQGLSKFSPALKSLGPAGEALGAIGGIFSTLSGLFGKSDEERAREAAEAQRVREEQLKILELQANYQKNMLALQEATAKLPFEDLQRQLRLIDIESQQAVLRGGDADVVERQRLARRQEALQGTLTSQSGAIAGGQLFSNVGSSPESLIQFLSERGAESLAVSQFVAGFSAIDTHPLHTDLGDSQIANLKTYKGKIPDALYQQFENYVTARNQQVAEAKQIWADIQSGRVSQLFTPAEFNRQVERLNSIYGSIAPQTLAQFSGAAQGLSSEISADTSVAENLLSTLEQSLANEKAIQENTKRTADNTGKALELRPDRERSFIDVAQGYIQSLGQRISSPSAVSIAQGLAQRNFTIPTEIGMANVTATRARTLQERMADALEKQISIGMTQTDILRDIRAAAVELVAVMDGDASTVRSISLTEFTALQADANRRRV